MTELYHFGIKGQRWGVRRFQSPDGTLTAAGKARYKAYKKDWKAYDKLNRHVSASQKHLKEEGVMLDRVRDKYLKENKNVEKVMRRSSGLFGLKGADKADAVAKAQVSMERIAGDYTKAAGSYGVAKKILDQDTQKLKHHVDNMIRSYGKGSINELQTKTVKMGQNKLQKLMQGAPTSIIFSKGRETEEFVKTGKTLADMPIIGNLYTSKYIAGRELDLVRSRVENAVKGAKRDTGKDGKDPKYLARDYFQGVSSETSAAGEGRYTEAKDRSNTAKSKLDSARAELEEFRANKAKASQNKGSKNKDSKSNESDRNSINKERELELKVRNAEREFNEASRNFNRVRKENPSAARRVEKAIDRRTREIQNEAIRRQKQYRKDQDRQRKRQQKQQRKEQQKQNGNTIGQKLAGAAVNIAGSAAATAAAAAAGPLAGYAARVAIKNHKKKKRQEAWNNFWGIKHSACSYRTIRSDELYHHGIKGQKWGVRRYQNSDGTLTAAGKKRYGKELNKNGGAYLVKGSIVQRVSDVDEHSGGRSDGSKHMYVAFTKEDKFKYKRYARDLGGTKFTLETPFGYQIDLKLKDDILAPSLKTQVDTAVEHVKSMSIDEVKKKFIDKKGYMKSNIYDDPEDFVSDLMRTNGKDKVSEFQQRAYLHYSRNLMKDKDLRDQFFNKLSEKGYNAVIDYNDAARSTIDAEGKTKVVKGFSEKPLIVFDSEKTLEKVGSHAITYSEMANDAKALRQMFDNRAALKKFGGAAVTVAAAVPTAFVSPMAATAISMYGGMFALAVPGTNDSNKATEYGYYEKVYKRFANMQKNDPVAYKKAVNEILDSVAKSKELEKKLEQEPPKDNKG